MSRRLIAVAVCLFVGQFAPAAEKSAAPVVSSAKKEVSGRRKVELQMQAPAQLDIADGQPVTVKDLLDRLREQHQISIRFDLPTFAWMFGAEAVAARPHPGATIALGGAVNRQHAAAPVCDVPCAKCAAAAPSPFRPATSPVVPAYSVLGGTAAVPTYANPVPAYAAPLPGALPEPPPPLVPVYYAPAQVGSVVPGQLLQYVPGPVAAVPASPSAAPVSPAQPPQAIPGAPVTPALPQPVPPPVSPPGAKAGPAGSPKPSAAASSDDNEAGIVDLLLSLPIDTRTVDLRNVSVATVLQLVLDASPTSAMLEDFSGMPIPLTNALMLDYVVEDDGVLITTRVKALLDKETRVYSVKHLKDCPPEELAKIIRQSVRPWSWRSQINDLGDQLKGAPLPAELITSAFKAGVQLAGGTIVPTAAETESKPAQQADESKQMAMLGNAVVNGLVTFAHAGLSALEMMHYAEPPTATIQTLPGRLIVTQSQAAHREIAELLRQLAEE
jgi:hypothetical protein